MLSPQIILIAIISYFVVLTAISYFTGKEDNNEVFFNAKRLHSSCLFLPKIINKTETRFKNMEIFKPSLKNQYI
jgi:hypothetical protein